MSRNVGSTLLALVVVSLGKVESAQAAPITYAFAGGRVTLSAVANGSAVMAPATFALAGEQVTVDESAGTLDSFSFTLSNESLTLTTAYAGFNAVHLDFASVTASGGTLTLIPPADNPQEYAYAIGPVTVSGQLDATGSGAPLSNAAFSVTNPIASGSLFVGSGPGGGTLTLDGISIGAIQPPGAGVPLVIKADVVFEGTSSVVPEPGAVLLFSDGFAVVALILRRRIA